MKLLIVHNKYQSFNTGGEDIVYQNELASLSNELGKENVYHYEVSNDDVRAIKILFEIWFSRTHYKNVRKMVKENHIDVVHVHNFFPLLTPSVFKAAKDGGAKVVHTLHNYRLWCLSGIFYRNGHGICEQCTKKRFSLAGIFHTCYRNSLLQSFLAQLAFWYYRFTGVFDAIDYFFVLSNFQKEKVISLGIKESKILLKPNSLNLEAKKSNSKSGYVYVGRLEESKGIFELLDIWKNLDEKYVLTIVGTGDLINLLSAHYNQANIIFKGKCSREETLETIAHSNYLIQPSLLYETFGLTIIEAFAYGVPVIGFEIGTRKDFITHGVNGSLCKKENFEKTILESFDFKEYDRLSLNALETSRKFDNNYVIKQQIELYKKIIG